MWLLEQLLHGDPSFWFLAAFTIIGSVLFVYFTFRVILFVRTQFFRQPYDLLERYGAGSWVVITGASDGIGLGFAVELSKRGFFVCLVSRSLEKLRIAEQEVLSVWGQAIPSKETDSFYLANCGSGIAKTKIIEADFRFCNEPTFWDTKLMPHLEGLDISMLINNVGINHTESFLTVSEQFLFDIVNVNCMSQIILTRKLINRLVDRCYTSDPTVLVAKGRSSNPTASPTSPNLMVYRRSAIINLSSVAGQRPLLYLSPYSATKAFNDFFSRALHLEFSEKSVFEGDSAEGGSLTRTVAELRPHHHLDVLSLRPGYVASNMSKIAEAGGLVLDRYECARGCLEKLGYVSETYGDPRHAVYAKSFFLLPEKVLALRRRARLKEKLAADAKKHEESKKKQ